MSFPTPKEAFDRLYSCLDERQKTDLWWMVSVNKKSAKTEYAYILAKVYAEEMAKYEDNSIRSRSGIANPFLFVTGLVFTAHTGVMSHHRRSALTRLNDQYEEAFVSGSTGVMWNVRQLLHGGWIVSCFDDEHSLANTEDWASASLIASVLHIKFAFIASRYPNSDPVLERREVNDIKEIARTFTRCQPDYTQKTRDLALKLKLSIERTHPSLLMPMDVALLIAEDALLMQETAKMVGKWRADLTAERLDVMLQVFGIRASMDELRALIKGD